MQDFHQNKVNTTHPLVLGSSIGIFIMSLFIGVGFYVNSQIASPLGTPSNALDFQPRYSGEFFAYSFIILLFNLLTFKLSLQGKQYGFFESLVHLFSEKNNATKIRKSYSWKSYWGKGSDCAKERFIAYMHEIKFTDSEITNIEAKKAFNNLFNDINQVYHHQFQQFIELLYTDICEENTRETKSDKCAIFLDVNNSQSEDSFQFKKWVFQSYGTFDYSSTTPFISSSAFVKRLLNLTPYFVLISLCILFLNMNSVYGTPLFVNAELETILALQVACFFGLVYGIFSFYFLRKTEIWREYWEKNGLDFLLLFHQQGVNKVPPYILPDTEHYNPKEYYKIFDTCKHLSIRNLYDDHRNMFFDDSQYYFYIIYSQMLNSYDLDLNTQQITPKKHTRLTFRTFQSF